MKLYKFRFEGHRYKIIADNEETVKYLKQLREKKAAFVEILELEELLKTYNLERLIPIIKDGKLYKRKIYGDEND